MSAAEASATTEPRRLGRYDIVHELGHGGMANVYLARVSGPAAFHKWVAVKQIHPHLAKEKHFVDMFLDEARIAASLSHPNVATVFDLGESDGEHYLAMEYLHGEHLGALTYRAVRESGRLSASLASWVVAEAARGLHHAHEARDPEGRPLSLIHRDVSPQNIFITYDGQVKLTDFGVAKAANRLTQTETGQTKGKVAYMAPEQALAGNVDRRLDIFALGTVLWEISVGRRLFKSQTKAQTLMRITSGKVPRPTKIWGDYPPELEAIVLRALALDPDARFPSAAAMADALDRFIAQRAEAVGGAKLAQVMKGLFAERMADRDRLLRELLDRPALEATETDVTEAIEGVDGLPDALSEKSAIVPARGASGPRWVLWAAALAVLGLALGGLFGYSQLPDSAVAQPMEAAGPTALRVESTPSGAAVLLDGEPLEGRTPVSVEETAAGHHRLTLTLDGFEALETEFDAPAHETTRLSYVLTRAQPDEVTPTASEPAELPAVPVESPAVRRPRRRVPVTSPTPSPTPSPSVAAEPGSVTFMALPWAAVSIDGGARRQTPVRGLQLAPGRHSVRYWVQGEGEPRTTTVQVTSGQAQTVRLVTR